MKRSLLIVLTALNWNCDPTGSDVPYAVVGKFQPCEVVFSPDVELFRMTKNAVNRWSLATGCSISIGPDGIPVRSVTALFVNRTENGGSRFSDIPADESIPLCGRASREPLFVEISLSGTCNKTYAVTHEVGHILAGRPGHSESGLMAAGDNPDRSLTIDSNSLSLVCAGLPCEVFMPE